MGENDGEAMRSSFAEDDFPMRNYEPDVSRLTQGSGYPGELSSLPRTHDDERILRSSEK
jgi:hypothetical protein